MVSAVISVAVAAGIALSGAGGFFLARVMTATSVVATCVAPTQAGRSLPMDEDLPTTGNQGFKW